MSLTSYRAAPPRVLAPLAGARGGPGRVRPRRPAARGDVRASRACGVVLLCPSSPPPAHVGPVSGASVGPGGDPLSRVLGRSTMGAAGFHGRVRDGIGWGTRAVAAGSGGRPGLPRGAGWGGRGLGLAGLAWVGGCARPAAGLPPGRGSSLGRLGPVGCARRRACTPGLSTWWSATALMARPGLRVGFPLRCLQRLSRPRLATRLRGWRHDRSTRGASAPVLSY